jgi:hypothetical protein
MFIKIQSYMKQAFSWLSEEIYKKCGAAHHGSIPS